MIIKFEVKNGTWQMYDDVDSFRYTKLGAFDLKLEEPEEIVDFTETISSINSDRDGYPGRVLVEFSNSKQLEESRIIAFSPIYIMNNNGRTIEAI